ncbi:CsgG/HfaB family protein [Magnetospirillum sp. UT-4]|uniref:CsgG/HfaB family protein n=1 Tax=Magnetospirillum sp. UT-4 TaxID=2681467 RepID=UPI0013836C8B|nr:CsgG/HfaB family protein [Magnetospirillum sp. UT-4]CAA7625152.1 Curli production assembly/transport component CsgG [Magnetospirillum sp. UT-4]
MRRLLTPAIPLALLALGGCAPGIATKGVEPAFSAPVTNNDTPYSRCLASLGQQPGSNLPVFAVGEVADKTGQFQATGNGTSTALTQGVSEMVMSAIYKTSKAKLVERYDLRIPLAQVRMAEQRLSAPESALRPGSVRGSDFVLVGALTELNYNIVSNGGRLSVGGIGGGARTVVINVGLDLRVVNSRTFEVPYITSLQKQIQGFEVEANVFRFFGTQLVEFDAGMIRNEPLQLGVRSVVEMGVYQIMTDFLGLKGPEECGLVQAKFHEDFLTKGKGESL